MEDLPECFEELDNIPESLEEKLAEIISNGEEQRKKDIISKILYDLY